MCGGGGGSSSKPPAVDVKTVATPSRRDVAAGQFTENAAPATTSTNTFGSELGGGAANNTIGS